MTQKHLVIKQRAAPFKDAQERQRAYRALFDSEVGVRVLNDLLDFAMVAKSPYVPGDIHQTYIHIGRQELGRHILMYLEVQIDDAPKAAPARGKLR
ncbi:MAG: hypothetical protein K2Q12_11130 [Rickettsiales bacterium]|nr:hypothetical protein [Rickettsiales bacterium]